MPKTRHGLVSIVLVNYRGADDTIEAIHQLSTMDWPSERLEIVVVENDSGDGSFDKIRAAAPTVNLVRSRKNLGFAGGCNLGVQASRGEFIGFLNNDAKPAEGWVSAAMKSFAASRQIGAVASQVLDWDGTQVDYIGSAMSWFGMGYKPFTGDTLVAGMPNGMQDVLFGTGSAMFVRRDVFKALGGFDERYFMFFEDVDFGWRLNLRGWRFLYNPESVAFHKHHASMAGLGEFKETYLLERNSVYTLYKNTEASVLGEALPAALALSVRRAVSRGELDSTSLDIRVRGGDDELNSSVPKQTLASLFAIDQFVENLPSLRKSREEIQRTRVLSDSRLWALFGRTDIVDYQNEYYLDGYEKIIRSFDVVEPPSSSKVLIITGDPIGTRMAGPAIRAWNMAAELSKTSDVTLMSLTGVGIEAEQFSLVCVEPGAEREFAKYERWADVIVFQGHAMDVFETLRSSKKIIVADVYDPMHLEQLEQARDLPQDEWSGRVGDAAESLNRQLIRADFLLCASERQRFFYLGQLSALGRVNPQNYADDPDFRHLLAVVPFGLSSEPAVHLANVLKGQVAGIGVDDKVLIWSGGLYNWFDPKTLIRAVAGLSLRHEEIRLYFQGVKHPHPGVPEMGIVAESRELAESLGVMNRNVFINDSWVDYASRGSYLIEADAGVSMHFDHIETAFSFRTRVLDYLWAELPMVVTDGDYFAELVRTEQLGIVVPATDVPALEAALERVLYDEEFIETARQNIRRVREAFYWERTLAPLVAFVNNPVRARDARKSTGPSRNRGEEARPRRMKRRMVRPLRDAGRIWNSLRTAGVSTTLRKVRRRIFPPR